MNPDPCLCGNIKCGMNCVCDWVEANPGENTYICQSDGIYEASKPNCNLCELVDDEPAAPICRRCGWEQQVDEGETYCRPQAVPHDYGDKQ